MSDIAIRVENLGKLYKIGALQRRHDTLRDRISDALLNPIKKVVKIAKGQRNPIKRETSFSTNDYIWALKDVSFDVKRGEVIGIIGRNGAGKTTLLKILSRITEPTEGRVEIRGRVGSLLEVGTGFHPELTGRENIYLNGAILGMKKSEIERKFDEIVAFAEIEKFLDTPVKRYSSGMYVRLAFAVAAHLDPEILLVDEVLAVGDAAFQKKCLGKMGDVAKGGRTVLFVSHQINSIRKLCERCIWLDAGHIKVIDTMIKVVSAYESLLTSTSFDVIKRNEDPYVPARFLGWEILEPRAEQPNHLTTLGPVKFKIMVHLNKPIRNGVHGIALWNSDNQLMWAWATYDLNLEQGTREFVYTLPSLPLRPGNYSWHVSLYNEGNLLDVWHCVPELIIATAPLTHDRDEWSGILNVPCDLHLH
jgi:lipopolysaccharide transport system ATP-binding protein